MNTQRFTPKGESSVNTGYSRGGTTTSEPSPTATLRMRVRMTANARTTFCQSKRDSRDCGFPLTVYVCTRTWEVVSQHRVCSTTRNFCYKTQTSM